VELILLCNQPKTHKSPTKSPPCILRQAIVNMFVYMFMVL